MEKWHNIVVILSQIWNSGKNLCKINVRENLKWQLKIFLSDLNNVLLAILGMSHLEKLLTVQMVRSRAVSEKKKEREELRQCLRFQDEEPHPGSSSYFYQIKTSLLLILVHLKSGSSSAFLFSRYSIHLGRLLDWKDASSWTGVTAFLWFCR